MSDITENGKEIININLRDKKDTNWDNYNFTITYSDGTILKENHLNNKFSKAHISAKYFNASCYNCVAKKNNVADLIIGDF